MLSDFARLPLATGLALTVIVMTAARGGAEAVSPAHAVSFDIPAQSLPKALTQFSFVTGIEILVDARLASNRPSAGVKGVLPAADALEILLIGSNLSAAEISPGTLALRADTPASGVEASVGEQGDLPYFFDVQRAVLDSLCQTPGAAPGAYRLALKMWIGKFGRVLLVRRLDTTGDATRDALVNSAVANLTIGAPPPPDLPQPVVVLVRPQERSDRRTCATWQPKASRASVRWRE